MSEHLSTQFKFLTFLKPNLELFRQRDTSLWNFRCPYCGDSQRSSTKARGYVYRNAKGLLSFQCHNCGENHHFRNFLKHVSPSLHDEYVLETFRGTKEEETLQPITKPKKVDFGDLATPITNLSRLHMARQYVDRRGIPKHHWDILWYTADFNALVRHMGLADHVPSDPRLLLVDCDNFGNPAIIVARELEAGSGLRYVTLKVDESYPKVFGLSRIDHTKPVRVVEGAIDSLFVDNCLASLDANLTRVEGLVDTIRNPIYIWDNEPRSPQTVRFMTETVKGNSRLVIFPSTITKKDINDMVLDGVDVERIIRNRTFSGVAATLELQRWNKTDGEQNRRKGGHRH